MTIEGNDVHTGVAKGKMINAIQVATDFNARLPFHDQAERTAGTEGFFHVYQFQGNLSHTTKTYLIRDFDANHFKKREELLNHVAAGLNTELGSERAHVKLTEQYRNMKEVLKSHMTVVNIAKEAMTDLGIKPDIHLVRGVIDGSKISFMGLPPPNLFAGGENMHNHYEFVSLQTMGQALNVLLKLSS